MRAAEAATAATAAQARTVARHASTVPRRPAVLAAAAWTASNQHHGRPAPGTVVRTFSSAPLRLARATEALLSTAVTR